MFNSTEGIVFNESFSTSLKDDIVAIQNYIAKINSGKNADEAFAATMREASIEAQNFVQGLNATTMSIEQAKSTIEKFTATQTMSEVAIMAQNKSLGNVKTLLNEYNSGMSTCGLTQEQFIESVGQSNRVLGKYLSNVSVGDAKMGGYTRSLIASKAATIGLQVATTALNMAISMGISVLISGLISGIDYLVHKEENLIEKSEEAADAIKEISDSFKSNSQTVSDIAKQFAELSQGVDSLTGKNISLSTDDYAEFLDLSNQLAEIFPTLNRNYDENGNAIVSLSGDVDTIVGSLNDLLEVERQIANQEIADKLPDLYNGVLTKSNQYKRELDELNNKVEVYSGARFY